MAAKPEYDLFVIGGGSGGVRAARMAGRYGATVALAEARRVGGTCVLRGCVPKKLMVYAARFRDDFEDALAYGWTFGEARFDWPTFIANKDREIDRLSAAYVRGLNNAKVRIIDDRATIVGPHKVRLGATGAEVTARHILIATGGRPNTDPDLPGAELAITSDDMFHLPVLPRRILIVGAGFVAIEFASIMNGLGAQTTLIHRGGEILRAFDDDIRKAMHAAMERRGIAIRTSDRVTAIRRDGDGLVAATQRGDDIRADQVLMAIGRSPNTAGIGLVEAGVELDASGAVKVDHHSRSTIDHVYAIGDVTNRINLTPVAIREGQAIADSLFGGRSVTVDHHDIPHAVFGIPEIGVVGLTEEAARSEFPAIDIYQTQFTPMRNSLSGRVEKVLIKLVVAGDGGRILGCHIIGEDAAELIQLMAVTIKLRATKADLDATMALHPTIAEEILTMREPVRRHRKAAE